MKIKQKTKRLVESFRSCNLELHSIFRCYISYWSLYKSFATIWFDKVHKLVRKIDHCNPLVELLILM